MTECLRSDFQHLLGLERAHRAELFHGIARIAGNDLKGRAGRVRVAFVIVGYYPHSSIIMGQPNLGTAQHMPGGMQAQGDRTKTRE